MPRLHRLLEHASEATRALVLPQLERMDPVTRSLVDLLLLDLSQAPSRGAAVEAVSVIHRLIQETRGGRG